MFQKVLNGILIEILPPETKTPEGFDLPDFMIKPSQQGKVVLVADNWSNSEDIKVGDTIIYALNAGQDAREIKQDGKTLMVLAPEEVIGIIE